MHKKALTVAIAGALAVPMAAHAVDFTLSGQVSRTLFINDSDTSTGAEIRDNNGATRVRANGHSVMEDGSTLGIQFEYTVATGLTTDDTVRLRHANVQYTNAAAGRITFGQGFEAGEGSSYLGPGVTGLGAGQDGGTMGAYFSSLDGGARTNMVRYDTPAIGPLRAAVSIGNNDSVSGLVAVSSDFGGTSFGAQVGTVQAKGETGQASASFGVTLPSGLSVGGAWGKGEDLVGRAAVAAVARYVAVSASGFASDLAGSTGGTATGITAQTQISALTPAQLAAAQAYINANLCIPTANANANAAAATVGSVAATCAAVPYSAAVPATTVDPSYFRLGIGYTFGDTTVAASWYNSEDFVSTGSEGTAFGIGASHALPKVGATVHASVQNYEVEIGGTSTDETVFQLGTLVTF